MAKEHAGGPPPYLLQEPQEEEKVIMHGRSQRGWRGEVGERNSPTTCRD